MLPNDIKATGKPVTFLDEPVCNKCVIKAVKTKQADNNYKQQQKNF